MELPRSLLYFGMLCVHYYEQFRRLLAVYFYPFAKFYVELVMSKYGITVVDGPPKKVNQIGIISEKREFFTRMMENGNFGLCESIVDKYVEVQDFSEFVFNNLRAGFGVELIDGYTWLAGNFNLQKGDMAWDIASHYDTGNDVFEKMLDPYMQYSCGYWKTAKDLNTAQLNKLELIGQKLNLKPGMKVLDIGCGFGGLAKYLAKNYGVSVVGCTISKEQAQFGEKLCEGLPVHFELCDYQKFKTTDKFDRIVSVGFMEHVGIFNYKTLYKIANDSLTDDGLFLLHTMGRNTERFPGTCKWSHVNIFPNGWLPKLEELITKAEDTFVVEDIHNFGADYYNTLAAWEKNFNAAWPQLRNKYGDRFYRVWTTYLQAAQGFLKSRSVQVYQIAYSKKGFVGGYQSTR